jgi:fluoride ion exporter CrcB/FEX
VILSICAFPYTPILAQRFAFVKYIIPFIFIGLLGGFTTFSAFGNDTINLLRDGETFNALANVGANVILGLALVWFGRTAAYLIWK